MTVERHLVLVHTPGFQDIQDFEEIAQKVRDLASDIEVFIVNNEIPSSVTRRRAARMPTLVFSPGTLIDFRPLRGKVYAGTAIPKLEQLARFKAAGVPVPPSAEITPGVVLPETVFGSHIVVKPGYSTASQGHHMTLVRREAVTFQPRESYPQDHPGRYGPMYAQRFVDTGECVNHHRVLTLFGTPLLAFKTSATVARAPLEAPDDVLATVMVKARRRDAPIERQLTHDPDILELARRCYSAIPEAPLQGIDIVREASTGRLFVLEANPGGNTWIFSKGEMSDRLKRALRVERLSDPFDAFTKAAKVLVERTRSEAR
jgi:glutathione synthase/RimK-type ligase-like ATP-grasp enzyme